MTTLKIHYWPLTPLLRELKFYVRGTLELSVFCDAEEMETIVAMLELHIHQIKKDSEE